MSLLSSNNSRLRRVLERVIIRINEVSETAIDPDDILNDEDYEPSENSTSETEELSVADDPPVNHGLTMKQMKSLTHTLVKKGDLVEECTVCLENMRFRQHVRTLCCEHRFHKKCIDSWFRRDTRCPMCRCEQSVSTRRTPAASQRVIRPRRGTSDE